MTLALPGEGISANISKRRFHRIWLCRTAVAVGARAALITPILVSAAEIGTRVRVASEVIGSLTASGTASRISRVAGIAAGSTSACIVGTGQGIPPVNVIGRLKLLGFDLTLQPRNISLDLVCTPNLFVPLLTPPGAGPSARASARAAVHLVRGLSLITCAPS